MSACRIPDCSSSSARSNGICDDCWDDRGRIFAQLPTLWLQAHNVLPPGSRGLTESVSPRTPGPRSPLTICALDALHSGAFEMAAWANECRRLRQLELVSTTGKRWGFILSQAIGTLWATDETLRYAEIGPDYLYSLFALERRLALVAGLDTLIHRLPAPCEHCKRRNVLIRHNGQEVVVCSYCGKRWSEPEYRRLVQVLVRRHSSVNVPSAERSGA